MKLQVKLPINILLIFPIIILSSFTEAHARGMEVMKDPVELFYADPGKITRAQAKKMVLKALKTNNKPKWIKRSSRAGVIRAEAEQGRLYAAIDINIDKEGIKISYVDSERMRFRERNNKRYIRDIYNKWVKSLSGELIRLAQSRYKLTLVSSKKRKIMKGLASGKALVVIAVRALPDTNPKLNGPKWSAKIGDYLVDVLNKKRSAKHVFLALEWNRETNRYVKGGHKKGYNKLACKANESQGVITVGVVVDSTDPDSTVDSEELVVTYFDCDTGKLIVRSTDADYEKGDNFDLQTAITYHVDKLLNEARF